MWNNLFQPMDFIQRGLEASWKRDAVIRNNIANIETPGFKASTLEFESLLREALEPAGSGFESARTHENHMRISSGLVGARTHSGHIELGRGSRNDLLNIRPQIVQNDETSMRHDGNNVCIEAENVRMAQNQLLYETMIAKMNGEITRLRMAITETR